MNDQIEHPRQTLIDLSLRKCRFQLRISDRIVRTAVPETAGLEADEVLPPDSSISAAEMCIAEKIFKLVWIRPSPSSSLH